MTNPKSKTVNDNSTCYGCTFKNSEVCGEMFMCDIVKSSSVFYSKLPRVFELE